MLDERDHHHRRPKPEQHAGQLEPDPVSIRAGGLREADGHGDLLRDQKQTDRAQAEQAAAEDELQDEADKALTGQGQTETATVETAQSPGIW